MMITITISQPPKNTYTLLKLNSHQNHSSYYQPNNNTLLFIITIFQTTMSNKKNIFKTIFTTNNIISGCGCGCGCGRPKLSQVFEPTPIPKTSSNRPLSSLTSTTIDDHHDCTSTTIDDHHQQVVETDPINNSNIPLSPCMKINDSVAVVKDSKDPYRDFKHSMLQMIVEKQIDSKEDLQALLNCFLELNSQPHHDVILRAFDEIWNEIFSAGRLSVSEKTSL